MPCDLCDEYYFNEESDGHYNKELDLTICDDCQKNVEEHHKVGQSPRSETSGAYPVRDMGNRLTRRH